MLVHIPRVRRRHRIRRVLIGGPVLLLVFVTAWALYRHFTRTPAPVIDYAAQVERMVSDGQPEGCDAWPILIAACRQAETVQTEIRDAAPYPPPPARPGGLAPLDFAGALDDPLRLDWIEPEIEAIDTMRERGVFDRMAEAAACPRAVRPLPGALFATAGSGALQADMARVRGLFKARALSMRLAAARDDAAERVAAFEQILAIARLVGSQPFLIDRLVGLACLAGALNEVGAELAEKPVDEATGRALLAAMDRQMPLPPIALCLEGERAIVLDWVQGAFTDDGHGDGHFDASRAAALMGPAGGAAPAPLGGLGSLFLAGRRDTTRVINEFYDRAIASSRLSPAERRTAGFDADAFSAGLGRRYTFATMFFPAVARVVGSTDGDDARLAATRILIAIETYRAARGALPESLDDLAPDFLPGVPADPTHGGSFVYRRDPADPAGRRYVLYSTGVDAVDDNGGIVSPDDPAADFSRGLDEDGTDVLYSGVKREEHVIEEGSE